MPQTVFDEAQAMERHPLGSRARVLLCSVFGPYGQDDEWGSRRINPMELYENQVTRGQGAWSLRMFHRSLGLMLIQCNIQAPCVVLDFPTLDRFIEEITQHQYDIVGISSIPLNVGKVREMCRLIRLHLPNAKIVIGGHISNVANLNESVDADYIVQGEGVRWFRRFLGEDENQLLRHPVTPSGFETRCTGVPAQRHRGDVAAVIIPSVGCPMGCDFCSTSAMFGGKGKSINFYESGDDLFHAMRQVADRLGVRSFFIMDENFLLYRKRALRLLELMEQRNKPWSLYVFSSAKVLRSYTMDQLIRLGISWVWLGIEGEDSQYVKLAGVDTFELVRDLQANGIKVLGSTIIGLENHTSGNINEAIDYAVRHDTDFHQFMLFTPNAGTPLHSRMTAAGVMKEPGTYDPGDIHGQGILNYRHPAFTDEQTTELMIRAFKRDFVVNGPSIVRIIRTTLAGWKQYKNHSDPRVRDRFKWEARELSTKFSVVVAAAKLYYRDNPRMYGKMLDILEGLYNEFGWVSRVSSALGARFLLWRIRQEERRLAKGFIYEPPTFCERNRAVKGRNDLTLCRSTSPLTKVYVPD